MKKCFFGKVAMFIKGLWSNYAIVNYEAKLNCSSVSCFKINPLSHLLVSNLALVPVMCRWLNRQAPPQLVCLHGVSRLSVLPLLISHESRVPWVSEQWPSLSALNLHVYLALPVCSGRLTSRAWPQQAQAHSWGLRLAAGVSLSYVSGNTILTRLKLCS